MLTHTPTDYPEIPDKAEKPGRGFESGGNQPNSETMDVWVEGLDRGEADQRPAPMTSSLLRNTWLSISLKV